MAAPAATSSRPGDAPARAARQSLVKLLRTRPLRLLFTLGGPGAGLSCRSDLFSPFRGRTRRTARADRSRAPPTPPPTASDIPLGATRTSARSRPGAGVRHQRATQDRRPDAHHRAHRPLCAEVQDHAGGLGTVYAAHDPLLSRLIAIKTLNLEIAPEEEREAFNALFLNEARRRRPRTRTSSRCSTPA